MAKLILLSVVALVAVTAVLARPDETKYTTKYDNVNLDDILKNDRLLNNYYKCLMETGNCSPDGAELKKVLPDALTTECSKCNEKQKESTEKVIRHLTEKKPELWSKLKAKYDPEGKYINKFATAAADHGIHA